MSERADLLVVGAGPAGAAAAITAARAGLRVVVCDKATFPRDKTCGDGLTASALRQLERLGLDLGALDGEYRHIRETVIVSPSGRRVVLPMPESGGHHVVVVPRARLDAALLEVVRASGAEVREATAVTDVVVGETSVKVGLDDDRGGDAIEAPFVVAADGQWSTVRRLVEPDAPHDRGEWHAARQYFSGVAGAGGADHAKRADHADHADHAERAGGAGDLDGRIWVVFEPDLLPGYAWVFPLPGGRANVGFGVLREGGRVGPRSGKEMHALWDDILARPIMREILGPAAEPEERVRAWPIPSHFDPDRLTHGRVLYAGDAAGVVDPMTGEGIGQALETGSLAARAVLRANALASTDSATVASIYRLSVERDLGLDLRFAAFLRRALRHRKGARFAIRVAGLTPWTRRNFARWMYEDYPRAILLTPRRWHRHMLTGPGAYR